MQLVLRALLALVLTVSAAIAQPSAARADDVVVWVRVPVERRVEVLSALRLELAGRATLVEDEPVFAERTDVSELRETARAAGATHAVWVVFPGGLLAPAEVRVLDLARTTAAHAMTAQAWDVVDPRVVAVLAASLIEASSSEAPVVAREEPSSEAAAVEATPVSEPVVVVAAVDPVPVSEPPAAEEAARMEELSVEAPSSRPRRTFSLIMPGLSYVHAWPGLLPSGFSLSVAFYARVSEWASLGLRFRIGGIGHSSVEGAIFSGGLGVPSIAIGFREPLGTAAAIEVGVHAEGGVYLDYVESFPERTRLSFGLGVGGFATLELGRWMGIQLDYTIDVYDFGGTAPTTVGTASLSYVHRWD